MTQDKIIEMARQTLSKDIDGLWLAGTPDLEAFAKLVAAKEREACAQLMFDIGSAKLATAIRERGEA